jgi:hypothetical protein
MNLTRDRPSDLAYGRRFTGYRRKRRRIFQVRPSSWIRLIEERPSSVPGATTRGFLVTVLLFIQLDLRRYRHGRQGEQLEFGIWMRISSSGIPRHSK